MTRVIQGITQFYLPPNTSHSCLYSSATEHHRPLAGTHCTYPRRDGQAELTWVDDYTEINFPHRELNPDTVTHARTNRARHRVTSLIWSTSLPTTPNHHQNTDLPAMSCHEQYNVLFYCRCGFMCKKSATKQITWLTNHIVIPATRQLTWSMKHAAMSVTDSRLCWSAFRNTLQHNVQQPKPCK